MANQTDRLFAALADPTRRAVLERLAEGPAVVGDLARPFAMALPTFLRHLGVLEAAGLVVTRKAGRRRIVALVPMGPAPAEAWLAAQRGRVAAQGTRLDVMARRIGSSNNPLPGDFAPH